ncbi:hypothetical protein N1851_015426 [Merluccius polli]|uniref:C17orf113 probable zinc finger domain-containing protein n=1 Tax=Merluccius polli TaxID=89951 RepID=A0AA47MT16_MERPO|nr:hypothetical protein N1851_015426 [Merluccius polli]
MSKRKADDPKQGSITYFFKKTPATASTSENDGERAEQGVEREDGMAGGGKTEKHRTSGWDPDWGADPKYKAWLYKTDLGMFCRICRTHKKSVKRGTQTRPFIEAPCVSYRKDKLDRHANSETHREALKRHVELMKGSL